MKNFLIILLASSVSSAPTSHGTCCMTKKVGEILYTLVESDNDDLTKQYGCKNGCVYHADEDPVDRFCFKDGDFPVTCLDDGDGHAFHWGYEGKEGPAHWADEFPVCNSTSQSPIDIVTGTPVKAQPTPLNFGNYDKIRVKELGNTGEHYGLPEEKSRLENGTVQNNGHTAQLDVIATLPGDVGVLSGGPLTGEYHILQLHFHWGSDDTKGSEHTLNGERFPMEMHIVHKKVGEPDFLNVTGGLAVTGFFFEVNTTDNPAIEPLVSVLKNIVKPDEFFDMSGSTFKITDLISGVAPLGSSDTTEYSSYSGSLTTPGCMEIVNWINFIKPIQISSDQLKKFRTLKDNKDHDIVDNFRPPQPLNGRPVTFYGP